MARERRKAKMKKAFVFLAASLLLALAFAAYSARGGSEPAGAFGARAKARTVFDMARTMAGD